MDGEDYRAVLQRSVPGMLNMAVVLHKDRSVEVQALVHHIRQLVLSLQSGNLDDLREATHTLISYIAETQHKCCFDYEMYKTMLMARSFVIVALKLVHSDHPALAAGEGVFVDLQNRSNLEQQQDDPQLNQSSISLRNPQLKRSMIGDRQLVYRTPQATSTPLSSHDQQQHTASAPLGGRSANLRQISRKRYSQPDTTSFSSDVEDEQPLMKKMKRQTEMCDYCDVSLSSEREQRMKHIAAKHKEHIYKYVDRALMCKNGYCDFPAPTARSLSIHMKKSHADPPSELDSLIVLEKPRPCPYCKKSKLETLHEVRDHVTLCAKRNQKPMLGCSACRATFFFVHEFVTHLKNKGGINHGQARLL